MPDLTILIGDFQNTVCFAVCQCIDLRIKYLDARGLDGIHKMRTLLDLLLALFAKHHSRENLGREYTEHTFGSQRQDFGTKVDWTSAFEESARKTFR